MDDLDVGATAEIDAIDAPEVSMDDTIRDTLREINERDESGQASDSATQNVEVKDVTKPAPEKNLSLAVDNTAEVTQDLNPLPNTWKKEAADAWSKADPVLRAEVQRREADIHKGIEQYKQAADWAHKVDQVINPYKDVFQKLNVSPEQAIGSLMAADYKLRFGTQNEKDAYFGQLALEYGINLHRATEVHQGIDPRVHRLEQENLRLQNTFQNYNQSVEQQANNQLNSEIETFAADPNHSHFDQVKLHMAALLQAGQATDLSDAYEQAIYANPATRSTVLQQQAAVAKEEASKRAQAAKLASGVNVRSRAALPTAQVMSTMDETIRETFRRLTGT